MAYWLMKCEPSSYSIQDLKLEQRTSWEGVRNYQARNFMRDEMKVGDLALFYHSNAKPSGAAGVMKIVRSGYADHHAFDPDHKYFDSKNNPDNPRWVMVDVEFVREFENFVSLAQIKSEAALDGIMVARRGSRLSIQPLSAEHFKIICQMAEGQTQK